MLLVSEVAQTILWNICLPRNNPDVAEFHLFIPFNFVFLVFRETFWWKVQIILQLLLHGSLLINSAHKTMNIYVYFFWSLTIAFYLNMKRTLFVWNWIWYFKPRSILEVSFLCLSRLRLKLYIAGPWAFKISVNLWYFCLVKMPMDFSRMRTVLKRIVHANDETPKFLIWNNGCYLFDICQFSLLRIGFNIWTWINLKAIFLMLNQLRWLKDHIFLPLFAQLIFERVIMGIRIVLLDSYTFW